MTIKEAAAFLGKSTKTIRRYIAEGCDISDEKSLREFSNYADLNARGRSAQLVWDRQPGAAPRKPAKQPTIVQSFITAISTLSGIKSELQRRLVSANDDERHMLEEEIRDIGESLRLADMIAGGYLA